MIDIYDRILQGDADVGIAFRAAKEFWNSFHNLHLNKKLKQLAEKIGPAQFKFEKTLREAMVTEDRQFAKQIMPLTALGVLYDYRNPGFGTNHLYAKRLVEAFRNSSTSVEVKGGYLDKAISVYNV